LLLSNKQILFDKIKKRNLYRCEESPLLRIREHSSKALLALINHDQYSNLIHQQIKQLMKQSKENIRQNTLHGRLLQVN
jgi:hypothetical protein